MTKIDVQFSITDAPLHILTKATMARRRKSLSLATPSNLFNHSQRSHQMQYSTVLPISSLSTVTDCKENLVRMASNKKSVKQITTPSPIPTEFRLKFPSNDMSQIRTRPISSNRAVASNIPKSSLSYPTILPRPITSYRSNNHQQQNARFLYLVKTPFALRRTTSSTRINLKQNLHPLPLHQQPHFLTSPLLPRPHPQYGHFLAYLRRQSLARLRRKQEEQHEDVYSDGIETIITFNSNRPTPPLFRSSSNLSFGASSPETSSSMPAISFQSKRKTRPMSSYRLLQRTSSSLPTNYRLNLNQTPPLRQPPPSPRIFSENRSDDHSLLLTPTSIVITPANSVVEETTNLPTNKAPYELQLSGDMLNYCYVSDSGVKYQGQLLSSPV